MESAERRSAGPSLFPQRRKHPVRWSAGGDRPWGNPPKAAHAGTEAPKASGLLVDKEHRLFLDGELSDSARVADRLKVAVAANEEHQVLIGADQDLPYREVVEVIDLIRGAGVRKYALKVTRAGT